MNLRLGNVLSFQTPSKLWFFSPKSFSNIILMYLKLLSTTLWRKISTADLRENVLMLNSYLNFNLTFFQSFSVRTFTFTENSKGFFRFKTQFTWGSLSNFPANCMSSHPSDLIWVSRSSVRPSFWEGVGESLSVGRTEFQMSSRIFPNWGRITSGTVPAAGEGTGVAPTLSSPILLLWLLPATTRPFIPF